MALAILSQFYGLYRVHQRLSSIRNKPDPTQSAVRWLRELAIDYVEVVPGATYLINTIFDKIEKICDKHQTQTEEIAAETRSKILSLNLDGVIVVKAIKTLRLLTNAMVQILVLGSDEVGKRLKEIAFLDRMPKAISQRLMGISEPRSKL
jgi:ABC-type hemin transport system substrate-binding protein